MADVLPNRPRPWLIAHRAANELATLDSAREAGADFLECDLWSYRGRLEIRHEKTLGNLPVRWDRWKLETMRTTHLDLETLLESWRGSGVLYIDLKGRDRRLPYALLDALDRHPVPVVASARRPAMLDPLAARGIPVFPSAGSEGDVQRLEQMSARRRWSGITVHRQVLTPGLVSRLRRMAPLVFSWPVNTRQDADRLVAMGVDGLIIDSVELIAELAGARVSG